MGENQIRKIIYFDKETIGNILQEKNKGNKQIQTGVQSTVETSGEVTTESSIKLSLPFMQKLSFLFSGRISARYLIKRENETTITSTDISEFDTLKSSLKVIEKVRLLDIENSSTSFRVAGNYLRIMKGQVGEVDVKAFNDVMNDYDGYDIYKINEKLFVRFNNTSFVSNYKRNDLLSTEMTLYAIKVGEFSKDDFDFFENIKNMEKMFNGINTKRTLADLSNSANKPDNYNQVVEKSELNEIVLYDVVYACIVGNEVDK